MARAQSARTCFEEVLQAEDRPEMADALHLAVRTAHLKTQLYPMARPIAVHGRGRREDGPGVAQWEP